MKSIYRRLTIGFVVALLSAGGIFAQQTRTIGGLIGRADNSLNLYVRAAAAGAAGQSAAIGNLTGRTDANLNLYVVFDATVANVMGVSTFPDGTLLNPSIAFTNDTDTGLYLGGTNQINLTCGNGLCGAFTSASLTAPGLVFIGTGQDAAIQRMAAATYGFRNGTTAAKLQLYQTTTGPVYNEIDMTAPTISSAFGTSPSVVAGSTSFSPRINVGTGAVATTGVIGMPAAPTGWNCMFNDITTTNATAFITKQTASTTTTVTVGNFTTAGAAGAWAASDIIVGSCVKY